MPKTVAAIRNGNDRGDAVVARVGHRPEVGQRVREELRERHQREPRREDEEEEQRQAEPDHVDRRRAPRRARRHDRAGIREERAHDAVRRPADVVVEAVEDAVAAGERRHDDVHGDERPGGSRKRDRRARDTPPARQRVPDAEPGNRQPHQLARRHRERGTDRERPQPIGVEEPDAEEEERDRERHRVDRRGRR